MSKRNNWKVLALSLSLTGGFCLPSAFGILNTITNLYEYFDTNTVGAVPSGWGAFTATSNGYIYVTNNISRSSPNSLLVVGTNTPGQVIASKTLSPIVVSNYDERVIVLFSMQVGQTDGTINTSMDNGVGFFSWRMTFNNIGHLVTTSNGPSTLVDFGLYQPNRWYDFSFAISPSQQTYDIEVRTNGSLFASADSLGFAFSNRNLSRFVLESRGNPSNNGFVHLDNLFIFVPEPSTALLAAGALTALCLRRRK